MIDHDYDPMPAIAGWALTAVIVALALGSGFFLGTIVERFL